MTSKEKVPPCAQDGQGEHLVAEPLRWQDSHDAQLLSRSYDVALVDEDPHSKTMPKLPPRVAGVLVHWQAGSSPAYTLMVASQAPCDTAHRIPELALGILLGGEGAPRADWKAVVVDDEPVEIVLIWRAAA